jgi:hypothetical protein
MPRLNWEIIILNIAEAREQLEKIEAMRAEGRRVSKVEFQLSMQHAYHHLNVAWNARHQPTKRYAHLTDEDFMNWGKLPVDLDFK